MTTTDQYQRLPDIFSVKQDVKLVQTNPRYPTYTQTHFTAGDVDQFEMYRDRSNGHNRKIESVDLASNIWQTLEKKDEKGGLIGEHTEWEKYSHLTSEAVDNTFLYLFNKFKKGVFIKIKDNQLSVFLPFSKHNFINEWGDRMKQPQKFADMTTFLIYASKVAGYNVRPEHINPNTFEWYANNCLIRNEQPLSENDRCVSNLKDMLLTLCKTRRVPDIELFFNRRDFPLIKKDSTEPYEHIFDTENYPLSSHLYKKYCPILSMVTTNSNTDIPFPTMEDWARVRSQEHGSFFYPDFKDYRYTFMMDWDKKKPTAIFRGASTGCGVTTTTNPRLKLALLSTKTPVENGYPLLDAGITKWNCRPRKLGKQPFLQVIDPKTVGIPLVSFLTPEQQSHYKYIINVDGHVSAFRLSLELSTGSVILLQDSKYRVWFRKYLQEYVHYVPIKEDMSDVLEKIRWCREHDDECKKIALNAKLFYDTYLTEKGILDFVQLLFCNIKRVTGDYFYNQVSIKDLLYTKQLGLLEILEPKTSAIFSFPFKTITPNILGGVKLYVQRHLVTKLISLKKIHESKDSIIQTGQLDRLLVNVKTSKRTHELVNEGFVGLKCLNKLRQDLPNFKYTYGFQRQGEMTQLFTEHVPGVMFQEWIKTSNAPDFVAVLQVITLALSVAQEQYGFVHNDLCPWNIVIKTLPAPEKIVYQFANQIVVVTSSIIPVLIDYDRSHVIYKEHHYGIIHPFMTSTFQDCFTLLITSVYEYCEKRSLSTGEMNMMLYLINFLTETIFHPKKIDNKAELMGFLRVNKKYNEIVYRNKCDLVSFEPCDLYEYMNHLPRSKLIIIEKVDGKKVNKPYTYVNPQFYYDLVTKQSTHKDILGYIDKIEDQLFTKAYEERYLKNFMYYVNAANSIYKTVLNVVDFIEQEEDQTKTVEEYEQEMRICTRILNRVSDQMTIKQTEPRTSTLYIPPSYKTTFGLAKYNPSTFSIPSTILTQVQGNFELRKIAYLSIRTMIRDLLLFEQPFTVENLPKKYGNVLVNVSPLAIINHNANILTLCELSKEVYTVDQTFLSDLENKPEKELRVISSILALCD